MTNDQEIILRAKNFPLMFNFPINRLDHNSQGTCFMAHVNDSNIFYFLSPYPHLKTSNMQKEKLTFLWK